MITCITAIALALFCLGAISGRSKTTHSFHHFASAVPRGAAFDLVAQDPPSQAGN